MCIATFSQHSQCTFMYLCPIMHSMNLMLILQKLYHFDVLDKVWTAKLQVINELIKVRAFVCRTCNYTKWPSYQSRLECFCSQHTCTMESCLTLWKRLRAPDKLTFCYLKSGISSCFIILNIYSM